MTESDWTVINRKGMLIEVEAPLDPDWDESKSAILHTWLLTNSIVPLRLIEIRSYTLSAIFTEEDAAKVLEKCAELGIKLVKYEK